jgi:hypothetical protein
MNIMNEQHEDVACGFFCFFLAGKGIIMVFQPSLKINHFLATV